MSFAFECKSLADTERLARKFADCVKDKGSFVCLTGDLGAGKTAFVKFVCDAINVKEKVTSPSFVILNEYKTGDIPVYHFDLYRLENVGVKSVIDELEQYSEGKMLTLVEWAEFSQNQIPFVRIEINIAYETEESRTFTFKAFGLENEILVRELLK